MGAKVSGFVVAMCAGVVGCGNVSGRKRWSSPCRPPGPRPGQIVDRRPPRTPPRRTPPSLRRGARRQAEMQRRRLSSQPRLSGGQTFSLKLTMGRSRLRARGLNLPDFCNVAACRTDQSVRLRRRDDSSRSNQARRGHGQVKQASCTPPPLPFSCLVHHRHPGGSGQQLFQTLPILGRQARRRLLCRTAQAARHRCRHVVRPTRCDAKRKRANLAKCAQAARWTSRTVALEPRLAAAARIRDQTSPDGRTPQRTGQPPPPPLANCKNLAISPSSFGR